MSKRRARAYIILRVTDVEEIGEIEESTLLSKIVIRNSILTKRFTESNDEKTTRRRREGYGAGRSTREVIQAIRGEIREEAGRS